MLIGAHDMATDAVYGIMSLEARLHAITVPTLVVSEAEALAPYADFLTERLPRCTKLVISDATPAAASQHGHAVMRFLHCNASVP